MTGSTFTSVDLRDYTTFGIGGPADTFIITSDTDELIAQIEDADKTGLPLFILGGGSNILISDEGFRGLVLKNDQQTIRISSLGPKTAEVVVSAGVIWDDLVAWSVEQGFGGLSALSGIPGTVGAAPVQNIGAYGHDVSEVITSLTAYDRELGQVVTLTAEDLEFSYRTSILKQSILTAQKASQEQHLSQHESSKQSPSASKGQDLSSSQHESPNYCSTGRWVVLDVTFSLSTESSEVVEYQELSHATSTPLGKKAPIHLIREKTLALRRNKGMVYDSDDPNTHSAGSFFTNPILTHKQACTLPDDAPRYPVGSRVKTSAAWLIDHAGFSRGFSLPGSRASLSHYHVLALTNQDRATAQEIRDLAAVIVEGVEAAFGISLKQEPISIGF